MEYNNSRAMMPPPNFHPTRKFIGPAFPPPPPPAAASKGGDAFDMFDHVNESTGYSLQAKWRQGGKKGRKKGKRGFRNANSQAKSQTKKKQKRDLTSKQIRKKFFEDNLDEISRLLIETTRSCGMSCVDHMGRPTHSHQLDQVLEQVGVFLGKSGLGNMTSKGSQGMLRINLLRLGFSFISTGIDHNREIVHLIVPPDPNAVTDPNNNLTGIKRPRDDGQRIDDYNDENFRKRRKLNEDVEFEKRVESEVQRRLEERVNQEVAKRMEESKKPPPPPPPPSQPPPEIEKSPNFNLERRKDVKPTSSSDHYEERKRESERRERSRSRDYTPPRRSHRERSVSPEDRRRRDYRDDRYYSSRRSYRRDERRRDDYRSSSSERRRERDGYYEDYSRRRNY